MNTTPWGFRDILPEEAQVREEIAASVRACFKARGYLPVETPLLEDPRALAGAGRAVDTPFKLFDDDGRLLAVRSDNTLPIVRLVSARLRDAELPLRLRYEAPLVRSQPRNVGAARQFTQLGFELIGLGGVEGDVEMLELVIDALRALDLSSWRIVAGSVRPFMKLLACAADEALARDLIELVHANDFVDLDARLAEADLAESLRRAISELPRLHGGVAVLDRVDALLAAAGITESQTDELRALAERFATYSAQGSFSFDFSIMNSFDYYTGLVFKAYASGMADPVGSGGRYDAALEGAFSGAGQVPAAGFAFSLERLEDALDAGDAAQGASADHAVVRAAEEALRIAVPKGSLKGGTVETLAAAGFDVSELVDPGRRLIVRGRDLRAPDAADFVGDVEFVIVRATDAPAFVAAGGADCGFCGRDSLIEANLNLLELIDMGYGVCRFIEAEPAGREGLAERAYARRGALRVATKYPRIARAWYERRGITADIVTLHGNIELGPIVGMTDRIVDITATGTTLRENDLVITGEIMECTARFFANPGRARLDARLHALTARLEAVRSL